MKAVWHSFLLLLAKATDRELARQLQFVKVENQILRGRLRARIKVTPQERRRRLKFGNPVGKAIREPISIVSPRTFLRWLHGATKMQSRNTQPSRLRTPKDIRELVLKLARENNWVYNRILGELKKLGVHKICRSTVVKGLKYTCFDPGPKRGEDSWDQFLKRHAETLWACDFCVWSSGRASSI